MQIDELIRQSRQAGVAEENLPFLLEPDQPTDAAVLLVHGFTASPWEMREVAQSLCQCGLSCLAIRLPGHGTSAEDLSRQPLESWQQAVREGHHLLGQAYSRLYGLGMSTGGLLLLELAAREKLQGLVLLSPYLELGHRLAPLSGLLRYVIRYQKRKIPDSARRYYYDKRPVAGIYQLRRLIRQARQQLPKIKIPTLVLSAQGDQTINVASTRELYQLLGSTAKSFYQYGLDVPHVLSTVNNPRLEDTLARISGFLIGLEAARKAAPPVPRPAGDRQPDCPNCR